MQLPSYTDEELSKPTTLWLTQFSKQWKAADSSGNRLEMDRLKSELISKVSSVRDDWFELIEAAKMVAASDKGRK